MRMPKKKDKIDILPVDRDTWQKMHYDPMYFVPHEPYDEYNFLKILSMKKKTEVKEKDVVEQTRRVMEKQY